MMIKISLVGNYEVSGELDLSEALLSYVHSMIKTTPQHFTTQTAPEAPTTSAEGGKVELCITNF